MDFEIVTDRGKMYDLARQYPLIYNLMTRVEMRQITFEQAMMTAVVVLLTENESLQQAVVGLMAQSATSLNLEEGILVAKRLSPTQRREIEQIVAQVIKTGRNLAK